MRFGCTLAFVAGAGLPGLAYFSGDLVNAQYKGLSSATFDKTMVNTFGLLEAVAVLSTVFSVSAWSLLNKFAVLQATEQ